MIISLKTCTSVTDLTDFISKQPQEYLRHFGSTDPISLLELDFLYFIWEDDKEIVGIIGCRYKEKYFIQEFCKKHWLVTMVGYDHKNKGIATTATRLLLREKLPRTITEVYSGIDKDNHANIRVKEKLGFLVARKKSNTIVYRYDRQTHV